MNAFDTSVLPGGYQWWYLDAISDDGQHALVVIAFVGSVFSPYYAWARQRREREPRRAEQSIAAENFCAVNVALYGRSGKRWAMTERSGAQLHRCADSLQIGPSALQWKGDSLQVQLDEISVPWPSRLCGQIRLHPAARNQQRYQLSETGGHQWQPIAPSARVEVDLSHPGLRWSGPGYLDSNRGEQPLEAGFRRWDWSRAALAGGRSAILYEAARLDGKSVSLALSFDRHGDVTAFEPPPDASLPSTRWGVARSTRSETAAAPVRVRQTLEDTPFYARSLIDTCLLGEPVTAMHESLSLQRFSTPWVRCMLPFRMPRRR